MCQNTDLRKLIKYEERLGVNNQQNDYYESLFRRTTASYRAKIDQENDKKTPVKRRSVHTEPSCSKRAGGAHRKVLREKNNGETSTSSYDLMSSVHSSKSSDEKKFDELKANRRSITILTKKILAQVLCEKYSHEFVEKDVKKSSEEDSSPIKSMIEHILKEKLNDWRHPLRHKQCLPISDPASLKSIIEGIVAEVLQEKFSNVQNENRKKSNTDEIKNLNQDLKRQLTISNNQDNLLPQESVNRPLDTQSLVQELLGSENVQNKNLKLSTADKLSPKACGIKRLQRSPRKKTEWQDPSLQDKILDKPVKAARAQSPVISSSARSGRSSSVLIHRAKSQKRKPTSDPVALYQYYKNEWEHFRNQIPGETSHARLRWHVRERLLDPK